MVKEIDHLQNENVQLYITINAIKYKYYEMKLTHYWTRKNIRWQ